jgi:superfamily II DNA or RNA helicase
MLKTKTVLNKWGGAFWIADCGFGKTKCIARLIYEIGRKTCVVVPQTILIEQMCAEFGKVLCTETDSNRVPALLHAKVAVLQGSWGKQTEEKKKLIKEADIVVASLDSLSLFQYPPELFNLFGLFIFDEAHHMAARTLCKVMNHIPSRNIVGFSATPNRTDGLSYLLHWIIGPTSYVFQRLPQITGKAHTVHVHPIKCPFKIEEKVLWNGIPKLAEMMNDLALSEERNTFIINTVKNIFSERRKILLITAFRSHAELLFDAFIQFEPQTVLLHGGLTKKQKKSITGVKVLVATYGVLQEGFDDADLDTLIMCTPRSTIQQVVGRIERTKEGKLVPLVIDFIDSHQIFQAMYRKRNTFYSSRGFLIQNHEIPKTININEMCVEMNNNE